MQGLEIHNGKVFFNKMVISTESKAFFKSRNIEHVILLSLILFSNLSLFVVISGGQ